MLKVGKIYQINRAGFEANYSINKNNEVFLPEFQNCLGHEISKILILKHVKDAKLSKCLTLSNNLKSYYVVFNFSLNKVVGLCVEKKGYFSETAFEEIKYA